MKPIEIKAMVKFAGDLFGDLKPEQLKLLAEKFAGFDKANVEATLKTHRAAHEFFSFPAFMDGARAEHARSQARLTRHREEKVVEWLSRQSADRGTKPVDAIMAHFKRAWAAVKDADADENSKQAVRRMILGHCRIALQQIGWTESDATEMAGECVELKPGERIVTKPMFRDVADAMRTPTPAEAIAELVGAK